MPRRTGPGRRRRPPHTLTSPQCTALSYRRCQAGVIMLPNKNCLVHPGDKLMRALRDYRIQTLHA